MDDGVSVPRRAFLLGLGCTSLAACPAWAAKATSTESDHPAGHDEPQPNYITFEMQVSWSTTISLQTFMSDLLNKDVKEIHLLISSTGGDISAAISCYNFLRAMNIQLTTYNLGDVDSAAVILFLAGQKRFCSPASRFLFHPASAHVHDQELSFSDYKDSIADLQSDIDRMKLIYATGTKIDDRKAEELLSRQNWVDPKMAMDLGVVDGIEALRIPRNATVSVLPVPD